MTWDLFTSARATRAAERGGGADGARNESLARTVALLQLGGEAPRAGAIECTVAEVNALAREALEGVLPPVRVAGEVANFVRARSGHCYFSLRDAEAQLRCVIWRDEARRLPTAPADGMRVRALGRATLYEARGEFQLVVSDLEAEGEGLWQLAFDRLRARLDVEGLTAPGRRRALPRLPMRVGVVTSPDGAALRDIVSVVRRRAPWTELVLRGCRVQGDGAAAEIAAAVRELGAHGGVDVMIVGRGGGSREDLWAFNEEAVARAIAAAPVPVVSAVGHETDVTIADLVADLRAPTPSAAAEAVVPDRAAIARELGAVRDALAHGVASRIAAGRAATEQVEQNLHRAAGRLVRARRERLAAAAGRLNALSPLATLARGYAVPLDDAGRVMRARDAFRTGSDFTLRVADGSVACRVVDPQQESP